MPAGSSPPSLQPDAWNELNHVDETYLAFSRASDIPRGIMLVVSLVPIVMGIVFITAMVIPSYQRGSDAAYEVVALAALALIAMGLFGLRFDLRLPKDLPIRFNRRQRKVYVTSYAWSANPFGRWRGGVEVYDWDTLDAEIVKQTGASGEVVTQRYSLQLVSRHPQSGEEQGRIILQRGGMTTKQFEEQWELIRLYMEQGLDAIPPQPLRNQNPPFIDCLLFAMPWFSPAEEGRRARARMGAGAWIMAGLMSLLFPFWLVCGLGNFIVMRLAPKAVWPPGRGRSVPGVAHLQRGRQAHKRHRPTRHGHCMALDIGRHAPKMD